MDTIHDITKEATSLAAENSRGLYSQNGNCWFNNKENNDAYCILYASIIYQSIL